MHRSAASVDNQVEPLL